VIADVLSGQLPRMPPGATHLLVCVGGNDLLREAGILAAPGGRTIGHALIELAAVADDFALDYYRMIAEVSRLDLPTTACLVYEPRFPDPAYRRAAWTALAVFDDRIRRVLSQVDRRIGVIDLREVCTREEDFANPIEPSAAGGAKI